MSRKVKLPFKLYPEEQRWWSGTDYQAVLNGMAMTRARRCLEFGPGSSTLALIEGGAETVDACEDDPTWAAVYDERLVSRFPDIVRMVRYTWTDPLQVPGVDERRYDLALIDGPRLTPRRPAVLHYALDRCKWVLMPCEEWQCTPFLRPIIEAAAAARGLTLKTWPTGPLSGAFALIGPTC